MIRKYIGFLLDSGTSHVALPSQKRNIWVANFVSLVIFIFLFVSLAYRMFLGGKFEVYRVLLIEAVISILPLIFNRLNFTNTGRILISWIPPVMILSNAAILMSYAVEVETSTFISHRFHLIAFATIPFLVFNSSEKGYLILGLSLPLVCLFYFDPIFNFFGIGYYQSGLHDTSYPYTNFRIFVSYSILGSSIFFLKQTLEKGERVNEHLLVELETKNKTIQGQAEEDVMQLNNQLQDNLEKLIKYNRELSLLNAITDASSKATHVHELLKDLCRLLVNQGGYKLTWIGEMPAPSEGKVLVKPLVSAGSPEDYVDGLRIDLNNPEHQTGPTARALLLGKTTVINNMATAAEYEPWQARAGDYGFHSSLAICIESRPNDDYVLNIYSEHEDSFDFHEVSILERIVQNVSNAIKSLRASKERDNAKRELLGTYERLNYHVNNTPLAIIERDMNLNITFWNKIAEELFGWEEREVLGKKTYQFLVPEEDIEVAQQTLEEMVTGDVNSTIKEVRNISKNGKVLFCKWYYSLLRNRDGSIQGLLSFVSDMTEVKTINYQLTERIKERTALYRVGQVLQNKDRLVDDVMKELVEILPPGWQYPEITAARIVVGGIEFKTSNFAQGVSTQRAEFFLPQGFKGIIEVVYLKETPEEAEGAFMAEERNLINLIAELLRTYFVSRFESEALRKSEANLNATINNTNVIIWSLDRNLNLLAYNRSFIKHMKERYDLEPEIGSQVLQNTKGESFEMLDQKWKSLCKRVLEGEAILFEENKFGIDFHCSLSPIIEDDGRITGVSIFADDITEDKLRSKELGEALKKIGELRLMALRSVMNPHFVFNVLNSIQFYIVANDRLNAVNYLSTFSKLIRNILTHSVDNKIKLEDEIEMLKNYVQLEMVRFENKFSFHLEVDPNLEIDSIEIPSLLIQPYVENAILHGLYNKEEKGNLIIRIREQDDSVVFEIEDDGVGREAAMKIRQRSFADHKSLGVKLTEERLKLINEHHNVSSQIIDLMKDGKPCGTKIIIWVKLYEQAQ